ncbi:proteoglycan 4-like [Coturnix japonica]|uniref:proteoglycan 4-like n=1 Tax=Coturnix japonica TaxID=93934 RepID=UPI0007773FDF|nr:proteoglycan 4-like [Coturnix japonica]
MPLAAAPRHAAAAHTELPRLTTRLTPASMRSASGSDRAMGSTACRLLVLVPRPQGSGQQQAMAARAENRQADLLVPTSPFQPAHRTPKLLRLAKLRLPVTTMPKIQQKPVATRPRPCRKPASPRQSAPTSTEETPASPAPVLVHEAGSGPADKMQPDPSVQEETRDADGASASCSTPPQQASDDDAEATCYFSWGMLVSRDTEERVRAWIIQHMFLTCLLCTSTDVTVLDVQEVKNETSERDTASPQNEADRLELTEALPHASVSSEGRQPQSTCGASCFGPAPPVHRAKASQKSTVLASRRRPVAARPKPIQKAAGPQQGAPSHTLLAPRTTAQVQVPEAGSGPADNMPPGPSAQEGRRDCEEAPTSDSHTAQQIVPYLPGPFQAGPVALRYRWVPPSLLRVHVELSCSLCKCNYTVKKNVKRNWKIPLKGMMKKRMPKSQ